MSDLTISDSEHLFDAAQAVIPGGVNSPVRSWRSVGGSPKFISRGKGSNIWDVDGNSYIDYVCSWGPLILGHAPESVVCAVEAVVKNGMSFGAPTKQEVELAELICDAVPSIDMVRLVNSGTEATMSAIRLARAFTGRDKILKFEGGYHGHADCMLIDAGSGLAHQSVPSSAGVPKNCAADTLVAPYNDLNSAGEVFKVHGEHLAGVVVEPIAGNMGVVPPIDGFLEGLQNLCSKYGAMLIFDEVITGFRAGWGGVQAECGITPDITCLGKIIGGGFPVGAYGGRKEVMDKVAPLGDMYQSGTLSGNPVAVAAGLATLTALKHPDTYERLARKTDSLASGLKAVFKESEVPCRINSVRGALTVFFTDGNVTNMSSAAASDMEAYGIFFRQMIKRGIYLPPSGYEAWFMSLAHTETDIEKTVEMATASLADSEFMRHLHGRELKPE